MKVRWHIDELNLVACCRLVGTSVDDSGLVLIRKHFEKFPHTIGFNQIYDVRSWAGYVTDEALIEHFNWGLEFLRVRSPATSIRPLNIYLTSQTAGTADITTQMGRLRGAPMNWTTSVSEAWTMAAPSIPLPSAVNKFFNSR
jgi:hypothetical protein